MTVDVILCVLPLLAQPLQDPANEGDDLRIEAFKARVDIRFTESMAEAKAPRKSRKVKCIYMSIYIGCLLEKPSKWYFRQL